jgi:hypothetical protein
MKKKRKSVIIGGLLWMSLWMYGQTPPVCFVNAGPMRVDSSSAGDTALYISGSMSTAGSLADIYQVGRTALRGSFYHDASTHGFSVDATGWGISTGELIFTGETPVSGTRYITASSLSSFDRGATYAALPGVTLLTNDTLILPGRMGIDAQNIHVGATKSGRLILCSDTAAGKVYDASLRVSGGGSSESLVDAGSVWIERDLSLYRLHNPGSSVGIADYPLFAFASPMKTMKSGYFAGNWVRRLATDPANYNHVQYVYGNQSTGGIIIQDQYLWDPTEAFENGKGYLVKARPDDFDYQQLIDEGGLSVTDAAASFYQKGKFIFDGNIYSMQSNFNEQVFAENTLFSQTVNATPAATINWVIGNSWTSAIRVDSLVKIIDNHPLIFEPSIYVWPAGSTTYQRYVAPGWNATPSNMPAPIGVIDIQSIPSQSIFMVRVLPGVAQNGTFSLNKRQVQTHSSAAHNTLRSASAFKDEILFKVSPSENRNIYDLTAVGLRPNAKEIADDQDMQKMFQSNSSIFMLYSLSTDNQKLSVNAVPNGTPSVKLCLQPGDHEQSMVITASRTESIEHAWLEDLLTHDFIDLKEETEYAFISSPNDTPERFIVHFANAPTGLETPEDNFLQCYYQSGQLVVKGLRESDLNSVLYIVDMQGRTLQRETITQAPEMRFSVNFEAGIYIAKLQGKRHITLKFKKGGYGL